MPNGNDGEDQDYTPDVGEALLEAFISPNETDSNLEPANVVDGLFAIARAVDRLAEAIKSFPASRD